MFAANTCAISGGWAPPRRTPPDMAAPSAPAGYGLAPAKLPVWYRPRMRCTMTATGPAAVRRPRLLATSVRHAERPAAARLGGPDWPEPELSRIHTQEQAKPHGIVTSEEHPGHRRPMEAYRNGGQGAAGFAQSARRRARHHGPRPARTAQRGGRNQGGQSLAVRRPGHRPRPHCRRTPRSKSRKSGSSSRRSCRIPMRSGLPMAFSPLRPRSRTMTPGDETAPPGQGPLEARAGMPARRHPPPPSRRAAPAARLPSAHSSSIPGITWPVP